MIISTPPGRNAAGIYGIEPPAFSRTVRATLHETATACLHFDPPLPGLIGGTLLQGWLVPKAGGSYVDLRAVAGGEVFPGIFGIPRRDLAEFFKSDRPCLLAGFDITLNLPAGRHVLRLEGLTLEGKWETVDSLERDVAPREAMTAAVDPVEAGAFGEMLRVLLRRMGDRRPAAAAILEATPRQRHLRHPPRPFHGHLDQPKIWARSVFGRLPISGWVFHESLPVKRVFATTDLQAVQNLRFGRATDFLVERSKGSALATHCGYDGFLDLPAQLPLPASVRVYAELEDGSWHLGSVARFAATDHEFAKRPLGAFSPGTFWRAWRTLVHEMRSRGWHGPAGASYHQAIREAWRDYSLQAPRRQQIKRESPVPAARNAANGKTARLHLITHNLSHEGAPLFLLEYARALAREPGVTLAVTSDREGPLRRDFETLGASVQVVDTAPLLAAIDGDQLHKALRVLGAQVDLAPADLVIANTVSTWWGVHLARQAGRPILFYIHESTPPHAFFRGFARTSPVLPAAEASFRLASRISFLTAATQRYYANLSDQSNYCLNPGWIDLAGIDRFRAEQARAALRARLGLAPGQKLVINVGTVCERKGQHLFARAVDRLWQTAPALASSAVFLMIGGRDTPYDRDLADFLVTMNRPSLRTVPETGEVYPFYGAADLFVCSSYEESFPRVILEAMAFALPIVSTDVHGIPEMVRAGREALLVPPGDSAALAAALRQMLVSPETGHEFAQRARARVAAEFDLRVVLPRHLALLRAMLREPG